MKDLLSEKLIASNTSPYTSNQIVFANTTPGVYTLNIEKGLFEVSICGAGGGGGGSATSHAWVGANGGSGAAFKGLIRFPKTTLTITIGHGGNSGYASGRNAPHGGNGSLSSIVQETTNLITAGGGNGGNGTGDYAYANNSAGGILIVGDADIISEIIKSNGVKASVISILGNGYGGGGSARASNSGTVGQNGFVEIIFKRRK